jgi:dihydroorotate dehydrogenase
MKTSFAIRGVEFKNRVLVASGTFGYGDEVSDLVDVGGLGGNITKSLSMKPREGNPPRRITETACGMLNSIGLANIGVQNFIAKKLPYLRTVDTTVLANIAASSSPTVTPNRWSPSCISRNTSLRSSVSCTTSLSGVELSLLLERTLRRWDLFW